VNMLPLPAPEVDKPLDRISRYHADRDRPPWVRKALSLLHRYGPRVRGRNLRGMCPYGGSQWLVLTSDAVDHVLIETRARPGLVRFARTWYVPDEAFLHTLIGNSRYAARCNPAPAFARFSPGVSAQRLTAADVNWLATRKGSVHETPYGRPTLLMARKFSSETFGIVDLVERELWPLPI
jgi:hypothetical protein